MRSSTFYSAVLILLSAILITAYVTGGDLNPGNTPSPTMRTLDELYTNIQPGLPSDWKPYPTAAQSAGAGSIHLWIGGGYPIAGGCTAAGKENSVVVVGLGHEINSPYDAASGLPTGKRVHTPVIITKYTDKASPQLYQALALNRTMNLIFRYYRTGPGGQEQEYYLVELINARIVNIKAAYPNLEQVSFVYERIRWLYVPDGVDFEDEWNQPPA